MDRIANGNLKREALWISTITVITPRSTSDSRIRKTKPDNGLKTKSDNDNDKDEDDSSASSESNISEESEYSENTESESD